MNKELERIANDILHFNPKDLLDDNVTKESLQADYDKFNEVCESLTLVEMKMLWYLRNSRVGETSRFFRIAKINYEAFQASLILKQP